MDPDSRSSQTFFLFALLLVASVIFVFASFAEGAISTLNRGRVQRLADQNSYAAARLMEFADHAAIYLASASVMRTASLLAAAVAVVQLLQQSLLGTDTLVAWISLLGGVMLLGWILPRAIAASWPERVMLSVAAPFGILCWVFSPLARLVAGATSRLARILGAEAPPEGPVVTPAELKVMVAASEEEGLIEEEERTMIDNILELEQISVREVMVPRPDIVALANVTTVRAAIDTFIQEGYSRLPVYRETIDDIVGILYGKDLLPLLLEGKLTDPVGNFARPAYFVPESKKTDDLLQELQQKRVHIAIIVDEYGGTAGLVTIEDLLEEIVGEIQDEFDVEEQKIVLSGEGEALVAGAVSIDDVNDALHLDLTTEEVETIGGLVYEQLGRVPVVGDQISLDHAVLTVVGATGRRVTLVRVQRVLENPVNGATQNGAA